MKRAVPELAALSGGKKAPGGGSFWGERSREQRRALLIPCVGASLQSVYLPLTVLWHT